MLSTSYAAWSLISFLCRRAPGPVPEPRRRLLCDAMTSGGLLAAIPAGAAMEGAAIGRLVAGDPGSIEVR